MSRMRQTISSIGEYILASDCLKLDNITYVKVWDSGLTFSDILYTFSILLILENLRVHTMSIGIVVAPDASRQPIRDCCYTLGCPFMPTVYTLKPLKGKTRDYFIFHHKYSPYKSVIFIMPEHEALGWRLSTLSLGVTIFEVVKSKKFKTWAVTQLMFTLVGWVLTVFSSHATQFHRCIIESFNQDGKNLFFSIWNSFTYTYTLFYVKVNTFEMSKHHFLPIQLIFSIVPLWIWDPNGQKSIKHHPTKVNIGGARAHSLKINYSLKF